MNLGNVAERQGDRALAVAHISQAVALFRDAGDRSGEASALNNLGSVEVRFGRTSAAVEHLEQALALLRDLDHPSEEAWALSNLGVADGEIYALNGQGEAARGAGRPGDAVAHHAEALSRARTTEAGMYEAHAHAGLGHAHRDLDNLDSAREHYQRALALYTELGVSDADGMRTHLTTLATGRPAGR